MAKPKGSTLQQKLGFNDGDLKTPKHDEIMIWLDQIIDLRLGRWLAWPSGWPEGQKEELYQSLVGKIELVTMERFKAGLTQEMREQRLEIEIAKAEQEKREKLEAWEQQKREQRENWEREASSRKTGSIFDLGFPEPPEPPKPYIHEPSIWTIDSLMIEEKKREAKETAQLIADLLKARPLPPNPGPKVTRKIWESPILDRSYTIGFADLSAHYVSPRLCLIALGQEISLENQPTIEAGWGSYESRAYFEVKTEIPSLGELIRQIRMYQTYTGGAPWYVVSPDSRFRAQIEAQGIGFIKYEPEAGSQEPLAGGV